MKIVRRQIPGIEFVAAGFLLAAILGPGGMVVAQRLGWGEILTLASAVIGVLLALAIHLVIFQPKKGG